MSEKPIRIAFELQLPVRQDRLPIRCCFELQPAIFSERIDRLF